MELWGHVSETIRNEVVRGKIKLIEVAKKDKSAGNTVTVVGMRREERRIIICKITKKTRVEHNKGRGRPKKMFKHCVLKDLREEEECEQR